MNSLVALAERAEKGSGFDRRLDNEIAVELKLIVERQMDDGRWAYWPIEHWKIKGSMASAYVVERYHFDSRYVPAWTSSLDAVVALIEERLPGWVWEVRQIAKIEWRAGLGCLKSPRDAWFGEADTEVRARLACALRALTAQEQKP